MCNRLTKTIGGRKFGRVGWLSLCSLGISPRYPSFGEGPVDGKQSTQAPYPFLPYSQGRLKFVNHPFHISPLYLRVDGDSSGEVKSSENLFLSEYSVSSSEKSD